VSGTITVDSATDEQDYGLHIKKNGGYSAFMVKLENEDATSTQNSWVIAQQDDGDFNLGDAYDDPKFVIQADTGYIGINEASPVRMLHVTDNGADPPVRIESLSSVATASDYHPVVWDISTGDLYYDSSINEDQDLFYTIKAANTAGGATDGGTFDAASTADTLTFDAGKGIEINAGTSDIVAVSLNASLDDLADVQVSSAVSGNILSYNGANWEPGSATAGGSHMSTQWVGADQWVPSTNAYGGAAESLVIVGSAGRTTGCRAVRDSASGDAISEFYAIVPIPINETLGGAGPMAGSHISSPGPDPTSGFPAAAPASCRVTCFFLMDITGAQGFDPAFRSGIYHTAQSFTANMNTFSDASGSTPPIEFTETIWTSTDATGPTTYRFCDHQYNTMVSSGASGYYLAISDFSSQAISVDGSDCGMHQFRILVQNYDDLNFIGSGFFGPDQLYLLGVRLQWIW